MSQEILSLAVPKRDGPLGAAEVPVKAFLSNGGGGDEIRRAPTFGRHPQHLDPPPPPGGGGGGLSSRGTHPPCEECRRDCTGWRPIVGLRAQQNEALVAQLFEPLVLRSQRSVEAETAVVAAAWHVLRIEHGICLGCLRGIVWPYSHNTAYRL